MDQKKIHINLEIDFPQSLFMMLLQNDSQNKFLTDLVPRMQFYSLIMVDKN